MRLVTYYTPSHKSMCERFVLSRAHEFSEVIAREYGQTCQTGAFKQAGWNECMRDKLDCLLRLPMDGKPTLYVDADVVLLPGLYAWCMKKLATMQHDCVAYSDDMIQWCAGVMLFRSTARVHDWWRLVDDLSPIWNLPDQDVIHQLRMQANERDGSLPIPMRVLPCTDVCNWATIGNRDVWRGQAFDVPQSCVAWHANWTIGVFAKEEMLRRVVAGETSQERLLPA